MAFIETTILSTREPVFGNRRLGQVIAVPSGRIDKVSVFLEPRIGDAEAAENINVRAEIYIVDSGHIPTGAPVASDTVVLSEISSRGFVNFRLEGIVPSVVAIVISSPMSTSENHVAWRFVATPTSGEEMLISSDSGSSWIQDVSKKFAFIGYSSVEDAVDLDDQSVEVRAGTSASVVDNTEGEFSVSELTRAVVDGDTVLIDFGNYIVTLVVDMSGSMTWNDSGGLRYDFLTDYIDDIEASLPATSSAQYSIVKFRSRKIGDLDTIIQSSESGVFVEAVRIVRKVGSAPTTPTDGLVVYEDFGTQYQDTGLTAGTSYYYTSFVVDSEGNFSEGRSDFGTPQSPSVPPLSTASLKATEVVDLVGGDDIGRRYVSLTWVHPSGFNYNSVTLVRRDDRPPETPEDGDIVFTSTGAPPATSYTDFDPDSVADFAVNGQTYYYAIFTADTSTGLKAFGANARRAEITISEVDRIWESAEPPFDTPPGGFDSTPPTAPTGIVATPGPNEILLTWTAGDADNQRYQVYVGDTEYPRKGNTSNGSAPYDGELIYDGMATEFAHRGLENDQPYFYVIVSYDEVANQSVAATVTGRPSASADPIPPDPVNNFSVEVVNATSILLTWDLSVSRARSVEAYFGDTVRLTGFLSFEDADPRTTSAEFSFVEDSREIKIFDENGNAVVDEAGTVDSELAIIFDRAPQDDVRSISADVSVIPFIQIQNLMAEVTLRVHPALTVRNRSTGNLVTQVVGPVVTIRLLNPFTLSIFNDPPQMVNVRSLSQECSDESFPEIQIQSVDGVYARSGTPFLAVLEAQYRGAALEDNIDLSISILDADTGEITDRIRLADTGADGVAAITTSNVLDEIIDRTGEITGESLERTIVQVSMPPLAAPGTFILEVLGSFRGFSRTTRLQVAYQSSLNIDVKTAAFNPDGVSFSEQEAFVYFGDPLSSDSEKDPVPELTITNWALTRIAGGSKSRPFFSRDNVPGTGVKAYARTGVARNIFFGPGTDVEPPDQTSCTTGELYLVTVTAEAAGMEGTGWGFVELHPFVPSDLKRIFLRASKDQVNEIGEDFETPKLAALEIFSDGSHEAAFEVVARPENDAETGIRSGTYFRNGVVNSGGLVPSLTDGTIVNLVVAPITEEGAANDVIIRTDLTGSGGKPGAAKATIIAGKATFYLKGNFRTSGKILEPPLQTEVGNPFYEGQDIVWATSPRVYAISAHVVLEIDGRPAIFSGGGSNLADSSPPAFVSFREPLAIAAPQG